MSRFQLAEGINICSNAEYHSDKRYLSSSSLKSLLKSAEQFHKEQSSPAPAAEGSHLDLGSFTHSLLLEPELIAEQYAFFDGFRRAGAAYEAFKLKNINKTIVAAGMRNTGERLAASVQAVPAALDLLKGGISEQSIALILQDVYVKARFDKINIDRSFILDVKTSRDPAGREYFKYTIKEYSYDLSAALYLAVAEAHYGKKFDFYWLVLSKDSTPEARLYKASEATLAKGHKEVRMALEKYKKCTTSGIWLDEPPPSRAIIESIEEI